MTCIPMRHPLFGMVCAESGDGSSPQNISCLVMGACCYGSSRDCMFPDLMWCKYGTEFLKIMKIKRALIRGLLWALPCTGFAASSSSVQFERIATQEDGTVILYAKNGWGSAANNSCSSGTGVLAFPATTAGGKAMAATALAAHLTQKNVIVYVSDSQCTAVGGMAPTVVRIDVVN